MPTAPTSARAMIRPNRTVRSRTSERSDSMTTMPITSFLSVMGRATSSAVAAERLPRSMLVQNVRRSLREAPACRSKSRSYWAKTVPSSEKMAADVMCVLTATARERFAGAAGVAERERRGAVARRRHRPAGRRRGRAAHASSRRRTPRSARRRRRPSRGAGRDTDRGQLFAPAKGSGTTV